MASQNPKIKAAGSTREPSPSGHAGIGATRVHYLGGLDGLLGFHLRLASVAMYRDFKKALGTLGLTQMQCAILQLVDANQGLSQADLVVFLGIDQATMMTTIKRLAARRLLERRASLEDRRRIELRLSKRGMQILAQAGKAIAEHERRFRTRLRTTELKDLVSSLRKLHNQI